MEVIFLLRIGGRNLPALPFVRRKAVFRTSRAIRPISTTFPLQDGCLRLLIPEAGRRSGGQGNIPIRDKAAFFYITTAT